MARSKIERNITYDDVRKKYYVNFNYGLDENGKQQLKRKTFDKVTDARKALREFESNKDKGEVDSYKTYTVSEWLQYWIDNIVKQSREQTTIYFYEQIIKNHLDPYFGKIQLSDLTPKKIQEYYTFKLSEKTKRGNVFSASSVKKHHNCLKTALELAVKQSIIAKNPTNSVVPPTVKTQEAKFYTPDQIKKLFELCEGDRLEVSIKLIAYLGLRREDEYVKQKLKFFENIIFGVKTAGFNVIKTLDSFEWNPNISIPNGLTREDVETFSFIPNKENLILMGAVGTGKTHLATAIGLTVCQNGKQVRFFTAAELANILLEKNQKGLLNSFLASLRKVDLMIIDEVGFVPLHKDAAELLFQVISDCYERRSLIITSNLEFSQWNTIFGDNRLTAALVDRLVHHSHIIIGLLGN